MSEQRVRGTHARLPHVGGRSVTRRLARVSTVHPGRVLGVCALVLVASVLAIGGSLGSALSSDATITSNPDSVRASDLLSRNLPAGEHVDEAVIIHSPRLVTTDPAFRGFVSDVRSSLFDTGATQTVGNPYAPRTAAAVSKDGHAVAVTVRLGHDPEDGIVDVIDQVQRSDSSPAFDVAITAPTR
jgi:hypothetical protein